MLTTLLLLILAQPEVIPAPTPSPVHDVADRIGGTTQLPAGTITLASPIRISDSLGFTIRGDGPATEIVYAGQPSHAIVSLTGSQYVTLENVWVKSYPRPVTAGIHLGRTAADRFAASRFTLREVWFGSWTTRSDFDNCVLVDSEYDGNNDLHRFESVRFGNYGGAAVKVARGSTQAHSLTFNGCGALGRHVAKHALQWDAKPFFRWTGGSGGQHTVSDFYLGDVGASAVIDGWNSEHSQRLLTTAGPTGAYGPIEIRNCRADSIEAKDGKAIVGKMRGPWSITGNYFAVATGVNRELTIDLSTNTGPVVATVTGNVFSHGAKPTGLIVRAPAGSSLTIRGNVHRWPGGSSID